MPQFELFTEPAEKGAADTKASAPALTRSNRYNFLGLPTAAFLEQLKGAPDDDFDLEDYLRYEWQKHLPLTPDEKPENDDSAALELPATDPAMRFIPLLNGLLITAVDLGGGVTACRDLLNAIDDTVYTREDSPARAEKQRQAVHRWPRHTLLFELSDLPGISPSQLWRALESVTPQTCPIMASIHGRQLPQATHDRLWLGIQTWDKPHGGDNISDNSSDEDRLRRDFISAEQMVLIGIKPNKRVAVRAAALNAASVLTARGDLYVWPELYHQVTDIAQSGHGLIKERAEELLEPVEKARDKAVERAMAGVRRTLQEWYREPPRS